MDGRNKLLTQALQQSGIITEEKLNNALREHETSYLSLQDVLIAKEYLSEKELHALLSEQLGLQIINLEEQAIQREALYAVPQGMTGKYNLLPLYIEEGTITVATADPLNTFALDDIAQVTGCAVTPLLASSKTIKEFLSHYSKKGINEDEKKDFVNISVLARENSTSYLKNFAEEESSVQEVDALLQKGVSFKASDIHLEPTSERLRVRMRIDGALQDLDPYSADNMPLVISRIKIMAGMDIAEKRIPQGGNIHTIWQGREINMRVSTMPTVYGEKIVLRLFNPEKIVFPIESLGFNSVNLTQYLQLLRNTSGMVLVTGPTGCGKTTTLYSTLHHINDPEKNIVTVEDPVEYRLEGINQVQVGEKTKLTFASALRHVLRQDPDIIMVGEIRDPETAEIATRAALTGHLVFSTLHTSDAPGAITRLLEMGVAPFELTASLVGVVSQRLLRLNCTNCKEKYYPGEDELLFYQGEGGSQQQPAFYRGNGCAKCNYSGYKGRTAIHEVLAIDKENRGFIRQWENNDTTMEKVFSGGMANLKQDGIRRVEEGSASVEEVIRETYTVF